MKALVLILSLISASAMARLHTKKETSPRLPRWYCTAVAPDDEHVNHSTVATTQSQSKRNALKECRYFHPESNGCRVRCWKL